MSADIVAIILYDLYPAANISIFFLDIKEISNIFMIFYNYRISRYPPPLTVPKAHPT